MSIKKQDKYNLKTRAYNILRLKYIIGIYYGLFLLIQ